MVSTSKILTVSYGTFSCTLEGFDDSFETMKAIAEYFRDLAAEDRYFGAEPPVPDADMLARIAEREIARRVEAREERGNIVLRAAPYGAVAAPLTPQPVAPQPQPQPQPAAPQAFAPAPQPAAPAPQPAAAAPAPVQTPAPQPAVAKAPDVPAMQTQPAAAAPAPQRPTPVPHPDPESVAAKLQRIRDVVTRSAPVADTYSEDEHAENFAEEFLAEATSHIESALSLDDQAMEAPTEAETDEIDALLSRLAGDDTAYAPAARPDAIADEEAPVQDAAIEDAVAEDATDTDTDLAAEAETLAETAEDAGEEAVETFLSLDEDAIEIIEDETAEDVAAAQDARDEADQDDDLAAEEAPLARVMKIKREDLEAAIARGELVEETSDADPAALADESAAGTARAPFSELSPEKEDELRRELAAVEAELLDLYRDTDDHAAPAATVTGLADLDDLDDDEDEDDDDDDIASIFDEDDAEDDSMEADADEAEEEKAPLVLRDPRERLGKVRAEDDMSRLMAKTENELTEPEGANRRNAIAHLRAAVAATKADQSAGVIPNRDPAANVFREDLASVMRPRRPVTEQASATPRPSEQRPAPLKLVAEQRVDLPETRSGAPVRPRRVSLAPLPEEAAIDEAPVTGKAEDEKGFADFARKMGATSLPDLLEAAAAYLVHVEAQEEFSRPQLMKKARQGSDDTLSREDGLRAFGQLLRQGKIQKIRAGRFTASDDISFKPAARRAG